MGRPTMLTPAVHAAIVAEVGKGTTLELAAEMAGVSRATVYEWMQRGQGEDAPAPYSDFADGVTRARASSKALVLSEIRDAVTAGQNPMPDWRARAWYLERTDRSGFGVKVEVTQKVEATFNEFIDRLRAELDPGTYARVLAVMSATLAGAGDGEADGEPVKSEH